MDRQPDAIDELIDEVIVDASGDDEQLDAFVAVIDEHLPLPTGGTVGGNPAGLLEIDAEGWPRHPLISYRSGGKTLRASLLDVAAPAGTELAALIEAYRRWAGLGAGQPTAAEVAREHPREWWYPLRTEPEGKRSARLVQRLRRRPLRLQYLGLWKPEEEYWGEPGEETDPLFDEIVAAGPRSECEMEQTLPGADVDGDYDPIVRAADLSRAGYGREAREVLRGVLAQDQRCIDAHGHLGNLMFDGNPAAALVHYQTGVAIGEMALPWRYTGLLPWGRIDNRPFLRCLHGMGLCLWRMGRRNQAEAVMHTMLWLNPADQQGQRFNHALVRDGLSWRDEE